MDDSWYNLSTRDQEKIFRKRAGTTDKGKDYEHLYIVYLILQLVLDDEVENFYLSSNDNDFGCFDDVVVEVKFKDRTETFAIQLKHVTKKTPLGPEQLIATSGKQDFGIMKYYVSYNKDLKSLRPDLKMILFTNSKINEKNTRQLDIGRVKVNLVGQKGHQLINTSATRAFCHSFEVIDGLDSHGYEEFFQNFSLYTDQENVGKLKDKAFELFNSKFGGDEPVFNDYVHFITQWSMNEGKKFKLDKNWMKRLITLCTLSPHIKPLVFVNDRCVNEKEKTLREAISVYDISVVEKSNYEKIKSLWSDVVDELEDLAKVMNINKKYSLFKENFKTTEDLYEQNASKVNKLMWLLGTCPLIVEGCPQVYKTTKIFCKNLILLDTAENFLETKTKNQDIILKYSQRKLFQNLCNLREETDLYEKLLTSFTYSLEGQKEVALKYLLQVCEQIDSVITLDQLVQMLDGPLVIGNQTEVLPPSHIERKLTRNLIELEFLEQMSKNSVAVVSCVKDVANFRSLLPQVELNEIFDINAIKIQNVWKEKRIYVCEKYILPQEFTALLTINLGIKFHYFRYLDNKYLEWIRSENGGSEEHFTELDKFRLRDEYGIYTLEESKLFENSEQDINIICADPGMGKSTLMKSLKNNSSSIKWTLVIYARNHFSHFRKNGADVEEFKKYVFDNTSRKNSSVFDRQVFKAMLDLNNIQLIWDGLDEVSDDTLEIILTLVQSFAKNGVQQWLTSRNNLKNKLESKLSRFSRNIKQFDEQEQQDYIKKRLQIPEDELIETFNKIKKNIMAFPNYEILGIPLQIYMLTELFSENTEKYLKLLDDVFTVLSLYEHFVREKFHVFYRDKKKIDLSVEDNFQTYEDAKESKLYFYKHIAACYYLKDLSVSNSKTFQLMSFFQEIKNKGDVIGFINQVTSINDVEFSHNSYGEYFAALHLFENDPAKIRDKKFISDSRYNNIRFFSDLMLSQNSIGFVAVVYKNPLLLERCTDLDLEQKDFIGRDILEVACAWNKRHPILRKRNAITKREWIINNKPIDDLDYATVSNMYTKIATTVKIVPCLKKLILFLPFTCEFYEKYPHTVLFYAVKFDFHIIFECIEQCSSLQYEFSTLEKDAFLMLAMYYRSERILQTLLLEEHNYRNLHCIDQLNISSIEMDEIFTNLLNLPNFRTDILSAKGQFLSHYASEKNLHKTLELLNKKSAKWDVADANGRLPIHYACEKGDKDTLRLLLEFGANVNLPDQDNRLPIHYLCDRDSAALLQLLISNGAKIDHPDANGQLPIHYACEKGKMEATKLFVENGAKLDVPDGNGLLPIHYAYQNSNKKLIKLFSSRNTEITSPNRDAGVIKLIVTSDTVVDPNDSFSVRNVLENSNVINTLTTNGSNVNIPDIYGKLPIHYACQNYLPPDKVLQILINKGADLNVPNTKGQLQKQYFSKNHETVLSLIESGSKLNDADLNGRLPIHYACESRHHLDTVRLLIERGARVDIPDTNGMLPIHYMCKQGKTDVVKLLVTNDVVNAVDAKGRQPIHYAIKSKNEDIINVLVTNGAILNVPDKKGRLPLHYACQKGCLEIVKILVKHGAKIDVTNAEGQLPIHCAATSRNVKLVEFLIDCDCSEYRSASSYVFCV